MVASLTDSEAASTTAEPVTPVNILLVDDQPGRLLTYNAILEPLGEHLVEARSGMEALQRLMDDEYALILLDVNMPEMDGFETASLIHRHPRFEKTPIIFVTAVNVSDMDRLRGYKLGAVDYVMVPVIPEILRSKVVVLIELFRKRRELQLTNTRLADANQALQLEKSRELDKLNASLRDANTQLAARNRQLHMEIGERARAERQLIEADLRKDEFLATLAHELRNPLAPLQNALNVRRLSHPDIDDPMQNTMERQLALLVRLIDDLLDVARITRSKLVLRINATTLEDVLRSAVETATPLIEAGAHRLELRLPPEPVPMLVDRDRLSQVFANLLNNAAKYSNPGGLIQVDCKVVDQQAQVRVRDSGIGIEASQIARIFELGSQVDATIERARGGLGIGLTLVQRLTKLHGGRIEVHSDGLGHGSEFCVVLPLQVATVDDVDTPAIESKADNDVVVPHHRCRALVVDDNRDAADTLKMLIELLDHEVRCLYDPNEAIEEIARFSPDVVFLDVGMPGLSGYDLARLLRKRPDGEHLLLVAVTGWGQPDDRRRSREAGFDHHLVKPPELDAIRDICERLPRDRPSA